VARWTRQSTMRASELQELKRSAEAVATAIGQIALPERASTKRRRRPILSGAALSGNTERARQRRCRMRARPPAVESWQEMSFQKPSLSKNPQNQIFEWK